MERPRTFRPILVAISLTSALSLTALAAPSDRSLSRSGAKTGRPPGPSSGVPASSRLLREPRLSIASPTPHALVGGLLPVTVAFDAGRFGKVTVLELWVDDLFYASAALDAPQGRGTSTLDLDTQRLRNGQHIVKIRALAGRKLVAEDQAGITVNNGDVDVVPPLISFYAPLEKETVSGTATIGVNASDNDQVALVGISVNRMPVMIRSNPPFTYSLDTSTLPLQGGKGAVTLDAMAIDRANNIGKARTITIFVNNPANATPMQPDPPAQVSRRPQPVDVTSRPASLRGKGEQGGVAKSAPAAGRAAPRTPPAVTMALRSQMAALPKEMSRPPALAPALATPRVARPKSTPAVPPATTAKLPSLSPADLQMRPAAAALAATPARPRAGTRALPSAGPRSSVHAPAAVAGPVGAPAPQVTEGRGRPILMARAMIPTAGLAERREPLALPAVDLRPAGSLAAGAESPAAPHLSGVRTATPRAVAKTPAPRTTPSVGEATAAAPAATSTTLAPLMAPARAVSTPVPVTRPMVTASLPKASRSPGPSGGETSLVPGRLTLPVFVARPVTGAAPRSLTYQVQRGDRLRTIAERFRVTPTSILVANGLPGGAALRPGRKLLIPGTFNIVLDHRRVRFDVSPRVEKGLPIAPFRHLFEQAGGVVVYYPGDRSVKAAKPDKEVRLQIGNTQALVNGAVVVMERAPLLDSGRTMVPVRFVTEALDMVAEYDVKTGSIYLVRK